MKKLFATILTVGLLGTIAVEAANPTGPNARKKRPRRPTLIVQYDANKDGKLDKNEQKKLLEERPKQIEQEYQKAVERAAKRRDRATKQMQNLEKRFTKANGDIDIKTFNKKAPRKGAKKAQRQPQPAK